MRPAIPGGLMDLLADITKSEEEVIFGNSREFAMSYEIFKQRGLDGRLRKTVKFWIMHLDLMKYQHMIHTAVQENDLKVLACKNICFMPAKAYYPFTFTLTKLTVHGTVLLSTALLSGNTLPRIKAIA